MSSEHCTNGIDNIRFAEILVSEKNGATTSYSSNPKFRENMFADWKTVLGHDHVIQSLDACDFAPIVEHLEEKKRLKTLMTKEEKKKVGRLPISLRLD